MYQKACACRPQLRGPCHWMCDEIKNREPGCERSLMHRFDQVCVAGPRALLGCLGRADRALLSVGKGYRVLQGT